jgi:hypothetical protein
VIFKYGYIEMQFLDIDQCIAFFKLAGREEEIIQIIEVIND